MNEDLRKDLSKLMQDKFDGYNRRRDEILKNKENIDVLSNLVLGLEESPLNLKHYSRETLTKILSSYHTNETIQKTLNTLEIARLVISLQDRGVSVDFNEEELNILVDFIEMIRGFRDIELDKFQQIVDTDVRDLDEKMAELTEIKAKVGEVNAGLSFINKREIDTVMHLVVEKEADDRQQISVLRFLNKINMSIYAGNLGK